MRYFQDKLLYQTLLVTCSLCFPPHISSFQKSGMYFCEIKLILLVKYTTQSNNSSKLTFRLLPKCAQWKAVFNWDICTSDFLIIRITSIFYLGLLEYSPICHVLHNSIFSPPYIILCASVLIYKSHKSTRLLNSLLLLVQMRLLGI